MADGGQLHRGTRRARTIGGIWAGDALRCLGDEEGEKGLAEQVIVKGQEQGRGRGQSHGDGSLG